MFFSVLIASVVMAGLTMASPLKARAGGPLSVPIPANCTLVNPLPHASDSCGNATVHGWKPSEAAMNNTAYYYLAQPDFLPYASRYQQCLEQCNYLTGCKGVVFANNAEIRKGYYGSDGNQLGLGCIMFQSSLTPNDFVPAKDGTWVNATAANIYC
jgi:hypothetical protein